MTHELLVIAGGGRKDDHAARAALLEHAAGQVPGFVAVRHRVESETTVAVLVETRHPGGSLAQLVDTAHGQRLTVGLSPRGLSLAGSSDLCGAESAHASVLLTREGGVQVSTDGVALLPVYWWCQDGVLIASTHLATLVSLGAGNTADERGVVEYLTYHHPLGTRTILRDCHMLAAGALLDWRAGRARVNQRGTPFQLSDESEMSNAEALCAFAEVWTEVVDDCTATGGRVGISLSGGMDSRTIAAEVAALGRLAGTFTYGDFRSAEVRVAARVATTLGLPSLRLPVDDGRVLAGAAETLAHLDGAHSPNEMYDAWFADDLRRNFDTVLNGHGGDPQWGNAKAIGVTDSSVVRNILWQRYRGSAATAARFLVGDLGGAAQELAWDSLTESLGQWDFAARGDVAVAWAMANRQRRWGNMLVTSLRRAGVRPQTPFLDRRFLELSSRFSPAQRLNGSLYLHVHTSLFPRTAVLPRSDDGNAPSSVNHLYWSGDASHLSQLVKLSRRHPVSGTRRGAKYALDLAAENLLPRVGADGGAHRRALRNSVFPLDSWLRTRAAYAERLLAPLREGAHPWISSSAVDASVRSVAAGRPNTSAASFGRLAALSGWLTDYEARAEARRRAVADARA